MKTITLENGTKVEISDESYKALQEAVKPKRFVPEEGQEYWYVDNFGYIDSDTWITYHTDKHYLNTGNCFETKEEAEKYQAKLKAIATITEYVYDNDMACTAKEVEDEYFDKYYFYYDQEMNGIEIGYWTYAKLYSPIPHINSEENAEKLLDKFPEELLAIYK